MRHGKSLILWPKRAAVGEHGLESRWGHPRRTVVGRVMSLPIRAGLVALAVTLLVTGLAIAGEPAQGRATPAAAPAPTTLDLGSLEKRLRETRAIGVFTKLSLKNKVDDLLEEFRAYHEGRGEMPLADLRERFDLLVLKVLSLVQKGDPPLARDIAASREALWRLLADPAKFENL